MKAPHLSWPVMLAMLSVALIAASAAMISLDAAAPLWKWILISTGAFATTLWLEIGLIVAAGGGACLLPRPSTQTAVLARHVGRHFAWTAEAMNLLVDLRELDALDRALSALERRLSTLRDLDANYPDWCELAGRWIALAADRSEPMRRLGPLPAEPDLALGRSLLPPDVNLSSRDLRIASIFLAEKRHLDVLREAHREWLAGTIERIDPATLRRRSSGADAAGPMRGREAPPRDES